MDELTYFSPSENLGQSSDIKTITAVRMAFNCHMDKNKNDDPEGAFYLVMYCLGVLISLEGLAMGVYGFIAFDDYIYVKLFTTTVILGGTVSLFILIPMYIYLIQMRRQRVADEFPIKEIKNKNDDPEEGAFYLVMYCLGVFISLEGLALGVYGFIAFDGIYVKLFTTAVILGGTVSLFLLVPRCIQLIQRVADEFPIVDAKPIAEMQSK